MARLLADRIRLQRAHRFSTFTCSASFLRTKSNFFLAPTASGAVFASVWVAVIAVGTYNQSSKLRERWGQAYDAYLAQTSAFPFAAIAAGRQRVVLSELPWPFLAAGAATAFAVRAVHAHLFAAQGVGIIAVLAIGPGFFIVVGLRRHARRTTQPRQT